MATRTNQRARTRRSIVDAVADLVDDGATDPSMEEIAERAGVSRATAYRYFDTATDAVWQVFADRLLPFVDDTTRVHGDDVEARALAAEQTVNDYLFGDADGARAFERAALDRSLRGVADEDDRPGRRLQFIDAALEPLAERIPADELGRIRHALALTMGSQVVAALLDSCRLDEADAREATRFAVRAIVREALRGTAAAEDGTASVV